MSSFEEVIRVNNEAADFAVGQVGTIDQLAGRLVVANTYVLSSNMGSEGLLNLDYPAMEALVKAADAAAELVPDTEPDTLRMPDESDAEYNHRSWVVRPLNILSSRFAREEFKGAGEEQLAQLKRAVWLASEAFEKILMDESVGDLPEAGYYLSNARAALPIS